jgi:hypothetical protein
MEAIRSSETSVYTISTRPYIPEDGILHSHRRENPKSYKTSKGLDSNNGFKFRGVQLMILLVKFLKMLKTNFIIFAVRMNTCGE